MAVNLSNVKISEVNRIVGVAWETNLEKGVKKINMAIGHDKTEVLIPHLEKLRLENNKLTDDIEWLKSELVELLGKIE